MLNNHKERLVWNSSLSNKAFEMLLHPKGCKALITEGKTRFRTADGAQGKDGTVLTEQLGTKLDGGQGRGRPVQVTALLKILSGGSQGGTQGLSISPPSAPHYPSLTLALTHCLYFSKHSGGFLPPRLCTTLALPCISNATPGASVVQTIFRCPPFCEAFPDRSPDLIKTAATTRAEHFCVPDAGLPPLQALSHLTLTTSV